MANIEITTDGSIALLRMRPEGPVTTLSRPFTAELAGALEEIDGDPGVRCAVLSGTGRSFVVGADIKEMQRLDTAERLAHNERLIAMTNHLAALRVPTIACINGYAL